MSDNIASTTSSTEPKSLEWALILGSSSGFGAATSIALAEQAGLNICGVHLRRPTTRTCSTK